MQAVIGGPVKIGYTSGDMRQRLAALQCGSPFELKVCRLEQGPRSQENVLHRRFAHLRLHGEWFEPGQDLLAYIGAAAEPHVQRITAPPLGLWAGPLCARDQRVFDALAEEDWREIRQIAPLAGATSAQANGALQRLTRLGRVQGRRMHHDGRYYTEWRALAAIPHPYPPTYPPTDTAQCEALGRSAA